MIKGKGSERMHVLVFQHTGTNVRFEFSTLLIFRILVFWDVNPTRQHNILEYQNPYSDMAFAGRGWQKWLSRYYKLPLCYTSECSVSLSLHSCLSIMWQKVMWVVNFVKMTSSEHNQLKVSMEEVCAQCSDLLLRSKIPRFSSGCLLLQFFAILKELKFL
jgi:hypothetical protein